MDARVVSEPLDISVEEDDRTVRESCEDIWRINPVRIRLLSQQDVKAGLTQ